MVILIVGVIWVLSFFKYLKKRKKLTYLKRNIKDFCYTSSFFLLLAFSLDWWRLNVSISTLKTSTGCFVAIGSRGHFILQNDGQITGYLNKKNRETDPVIMIDKAAKSSDCYTVEYYFYLFEPTLYSIKKIILKENI